MTILGKHTVAELRELITDKDFSIKQTLALYSSFNTPWKSSAEHAEWKKDWDIFFDRYSKARSTAKQKMFIITAANPLVGPTVMPAETEWQLVKHAITVSGQGDYVKGDLPDLQHRLETASNRSIDYSGRPGYTASDLDMVAYKQADGSIKIIEKGGEAAKELATSGTALYLYGILGIAGAGGLLYLAKR